MQVPARNLNSR